MPSSNRALAWLRLLALGLFILLAFRVTYSVYMVGRTGVLEISTSEPSAVISVSQPNKQATLLGKNDVRVRLLPGTYQVSAKLSGNQSYKTVTITKGKTTTARINPVQSIVQSSVDKTGYVNFDVLMNHGLSEDQITYLKQMLTSFAPKASTFTVQADTVQRASRDPNGNSPFEVDCQITIDGATYDAALTYPDDTVLQLTLTDTQTSTQVYLGREPSSPDS